jgi:hypothetical protein
MSGRRSVPGGAGPTSARASGARPILKLRFPQAAGPAPPEFAELVDRIDRLETRQSRRT